jgi:hypothetical protein
MDWVVDTTFERINVPQAGICVDAAFLNNVTFKRWKCDGADGSGSAASTGSAGFSFIYDTPNLGSNNTGFSYTDSQYVSLLDNNVTNFNSGAYISSGAHYTLRGNYWTANVGTNSVAGVGVQIHDNDNIASGGQHPSDITIADHFRGNGNATAGGDLCLVWNAAILSGSIDRVTVARSDFASNVGGRNFQLDAQLRSGHVCSASAE